MKWGISFKEKSVTRDTLPLVYGGRLGSPESTKESDWVFKNTPLVNGRTDLAEMLPGGKMKHTEDVSESLSLLKTN